jgi:hypothetical protein
MMLKEIKDYLDLFEDRYFKIYTIGDRAFIEIKVNSVNISYKVLYVGNESYVEKFETFFALNTETRINQKAISVEEYNKIKELIKNYI